MCGSVTCQNLPVVWVGAVGYKRTSMLISASKTPAGLHRAANRCHHCGATCYHRVVSRDDKGSMRATAQLVCAGCHQQFADVKAWRTGESAGRCM